MKPSIKEFTKIDGNTTSYSINGIKTSEQIRVEQDADLVLKNLKLKKVGQLHDDVLLASDRRFIQYKTYEDRIILKDGLLFRKNYGETGSVKFSHRSSLLMNYSGISTGNLVNILELPKR